MRFTPSSLKAGIMPFAAILGHDLRILWASWLVRFWVLATALLAMIQVLSNWDRFQDAPAIALLLFPYLIFPWSLVVMVLSVAPVSGWQANVVADAFLSRPITATRLPVGCMDRACYRRAERILARHGTGHRDHLSRRAARSGG